VLYARVSSHDQRPDLERQKQRLLDHAQAQGWADPLLVADLGSGMNFAKPGLRRLIGMVLRGEVARIVVENKDRLLRFGFDLVAWICAGRGCEIVITAAVAARPALTLRLAARVKHLGIPIIHYVAPQVWAWRPGRVKKIAQRVDRILALLPFEAPIFEAAGIPVDFVGHPILESEAAHGVAEHAPGSGRRLIIMPGSRRGEVSRLLPIFAESLKRLPADIHPIIGLAGTVEEMVRARSAEWGRPVSLVRSPQDKADAFAAARAGLIKSGTSSLEAAVAGLPHVIAYTFSPVSNFIIRRLFRLKYASLVNLLLDEPVVPEFLLPHCEPIRISAGLTRLLEDDAAVEKQREGFARALARLRPEHGLPSEAAAEAVLRQL
jgi:lipid-A-disaccharide synthase